MSLNDALLAGPDLLQPLTSVLYTFRERPVAFGGDIREVFHQVKIMEKDTPAQRFLWRDMACSSPPEVYQMEVMIFGAVSSPCSAQFAKNVNAQRFADTLPEAVDAILKKHYMDDYLDSADTELEAIKLSTSMSKAVSRCGTGSQVPAEFCKRSRNIFVREEISTSAAAPLCQQSEHWESDGIPTTTVLSFRSVQLCARQPMKRP